MAFKLKDLMIDVLPGSPGAQAANPLAQCPIPSGGTQQQLAAGVMCPIPSAQNTVCPFPSLMAQGICPMFSATQTGMVQVQAQSICPMFSATSPTATCAVAAGQSPDVAQMTNLATLKQQLQQALDHVNRHQETVHAAAKPRTVAEAEALEKQMQEALAELQAHKAKLKTAGS